MDAPIAMTQPLGGRPVHVESIPHDQMESELTTQLPQEGHHRVGDDVLVREEGKVSSRPSGDAATRSGRRSSRSVHAIVHVDKGWC